MLILEGKFNTHTYMYIYPSGQVLNMNKTIKKMENKFKGLLYILAVLVSQRKIKKLSLSHE